MRHLNRIASRIAAQYEEDIDESQDELEVGDDVDSELDITSATTEYACNVELLLNATFDGQVSKADLVSKLKAELQSAIESSMKVVSDDLGLNKTEVKVLPIKIDCSLIDESDLGADEFGLGDGSDTDTSEEEGSKSSDAGELSEDYGDQVDESSELDLEGSVDYSENSDDNESDDLESSMDESSGSAESLEDLLDESDDSDDDSDDESSSDD
jgi:hypothetical protein